MRRGGAAVAAAALRWGWAEGAPRGAQAHAVALGGGWARARAARVSAATGSDGETEVSESRVSWGACGWLCVPCVCLVAEG